MLLRFLALLLAAGISLVFFQFSGEAGLFDRLPVDETLVWKLNPFGETVWVKTHPASLYAYSDGKHGGIDFMLPDERIPVFAGLDGIVSKVSRTGVRLMHGEYEIIYVHLDGIPVSLAVGDRVGMDTFLGYVEIDIGNTHLHLEVRKDGYIINPLPLLNSQWLQGIKFVGYEDSSESADPYNQKSIKLS